MEVSKKVFLQVLTFPGILEPSPSDRGVPGTAPSSPYELAGAAATA